VFTAADTNCANGILSDDDTYCCAPYCDSCSITNCEDIDASPWACCPNGIDDIGKLCIDSQAPCRMHYGDIVSADTPSVKRFTRVGVRVKGDEVLSREKKYNVHIDSALIFQKIDELSIYSVKRLQDEGFYVQLVIEFTANYANLHSIGSGSYDWKLKEFAHNAAKNGKPFTIRILHEFNDLGYSWSVYKNGNGDANTFKNAFQHVVRVLRDNGAPVKIQLGYNRLNYQNDPLPLKAYYPGDQYVDEVCVSVYNRAGLDKWHTKYVSFKDLFKDVYYQVCELCCNYVHPCAVINIFFSLFC
jgi:beta-mannanase